MNHLAIITHCIAMDARHIFQARRGYAKYKNNRHLDSFTRWEIYNLYMEYVEGAEGNDNFIKYAYFTRVAKKRFNNVRIHKRTRMGICSTCASLKERRDRKRFVYKIVYFLDKY